MIHFQFSIFELDTFRFKVFNKPFSHSKLFTRTCLFNSFILTLFLFLFLVCVLFLFLVCVLFLFLVCVLFVLFLVFIRIDSLLSILLNRLFLNSCSDQRYGFFTFFDIFDQLFNRIVPFWLFLPQQSTTEMFIHIYLYFFKQINNMAIPTINFFIFHHLHLHKIKVGAFMLCFQKTENIVAILPSEILQSFFHRLK